MTLPPLHEPPAAIRALAAFDLTIQGGTHYEWSLLPTFPATSWCPRVEDGRCTPGWGQPLAEFYTVAWFDRWLKTPGEPGYDDADARLLADERWRERLSFYFRSARSFPTRDGVHAVCEDIRAGCTNPAPAGARSGGGLSGLTLLWLGLLTAARAARRSGRPLQALCANARKPLRPDNKKNPRRERLGFSYWWAVRDSNPGPSD